VLIRGTVTDAEGVPIEWAAAWFASGDHPTPDIAAVTDASGAFTLTAPAPGTYRVGCRAEGHAPVEVSVEVAGDDVDLTITLPRDTPSA
jgi:protocatechuate 3,4-dioxygenase beta subunit